MSILDARKNFAISNLSTGYDNSATVIVVESGSGSNFPDPSTNGAFNLVWWNYTDYKNPSDDPNVEIVRCTARVGDTLTVSRAQEGTTATNKNVFGRTYKIMNALTKKTIDDIESKLLWKDTGTGGFVSLNTPRDVKLERGLWVDGTTGATPTSGVGTRLMWIPSKKAFRAGCVAGTEWDDANIGTGSNVLGCNIQASGNYSFSAGFGNVITSISTYGVAIGAGATVDGIGCISISFNGTASGEGSLQFGYYGTASGVGATSIGTSVNIYGNYSSGIGSSNNLNNDYQVAVGDNITLAGAGDMGLGHYANVSSTTYPSMMIAVGDYSMGTSLTQDNTLAIMGSTTAGKTVPFRVGIDTVAPPSKLTVHNGDIEVEDDNGVDFPYGTSGLITHTPNGTRVRVTVDDTLAVRVTAI